MSRIKTKEKPCSGIGKAKGVKGCKTLTKYRKYGLCHTCLADWLLYNDNGKLVLEAATLKAKTKVSKESEKKRKIEKKEQKIKYSDWPKKLQERVNEIARLIDMGQPCLARGYHAKQIHGGHIFSRGSHPSMRYNLLNIHRQSAQSNHFQNEDGLLREGLVKEYGQEFYDYLNHLRQTPALKYSNEEYHNFYRKACKIALEIKKAGMVYDKESRIEMRNKVNYQLGIYDEKYCFF